MSRRHARTFTLASRFLPPAKRRAAFAVYAFCRTADDIVDLASPGIDSAAALDRYRVRLDAALDGDPDDAVFRELLRAVNGIFPIAICLRHGLWWAAGLGTLAMAVPLTWRRVRATQLVSGPSR